MANEETAAPAAAPVHTADPSKVYDPMAVLRDFTAKLEAEEAAAEAPKQRPAEAEPEKPSEPETKPVAEKKSASVKGLAAKLAGKPEAAPEQPKRAEWDENATAALRKLGLREDEVPKLQALAEENPWLRGFVDGAQKRITKSDADYAALKAGTREPTPGARDNAAQKQGDQPGSGQVADLVETLTAKLTEELGDDNAQLLRQAFQSQNDQIAELHAKLDGYTRTVQQERDAAEIEAMVQSARSSLREEFSWIDDDQRFESVVTELATLRPDSVTREGITEAMRKAARIVFFDDVRADASAAASKLDSKRKARTSEVGPRDTPNEDDSPILDERQQFVRMHEMQLAGVPLDDITRFARRNQERRLRAQRRT